MHSTTKQTNNIEHAPNDTFLIRAADIILSILGLIFAIPIMILITILVKSQSKGKVFFIQERLGQQKQPFNLIKFRTMREDAENNGPSWSSANDPRITNVGKWLRKTRLDELPQLINILKGDMSFIGPRPIRSHFAEILQDLNPSYEQRFILKPGLTGWAQIYAPYGINTDEQLEKLPFDLKYLEGFNLKEYFQLIILTFTYVFKGQGI